MAGLAFTTALARASAAGPALCFALALLLAACSQSIEVLDPAPAAAGGPAPGDAGLVPDPDDEGTRIDASDACGRCGATQLCAVDRCIDADGVTSIASSFAHVCRVERGQLFCWGNNADGQLGTGDRNDRDAPVRVGSFDDWLQVTAGEGHSCALRAPGVVYCWGDNSSAQLGVGDTEPRLAPAAVAFAEPVVVVQVECGGESCCAIDAAGALFCWGSNVEGKTGQDDLYNAPDVSTPSEVAGGARYRALAIGQGHTCAIRTDGALYCWGRNSDGELGIGTEPVQTRAPVRVGDAADWRVIAASQHHSCGVRDDGSLWCWGRNPFFELAAPDPAVMYPEPEAVGREFDWADVKAGWFHGCALKRDARMFCWGRGIEGQLGRPLPIPGQLVDLEGMPLPEPGAVESPARWRRFTTGNFHTCGVDDSGATLCWGGNGDGQLGVGDGERRQVPSSVR